MTGILESISLVPGNGDTMFVHLVDEDTTKSHLVSLTGLHVNGVFVLFSEFFLFFANAVKIEVTLNPDADAFGLLLQTFFKEAF